MGSVVYPPAFTTPRSSSLQGKSSAVSFPITEPSPGIPTPTKPAPPPPSPHVTSQLQPRHLPFRRISLPGPPSMILADRTSIVSDGSFEVHVEDGPITPSTHGAQLRNLKLSSYMGDSPVSGGGRRRSRARRESSAKPDDRTRSGQEEIKMLAKRQKIIEEFYETEKAYVDGLELVYSHFLTPIISSLDDSEPLLNRSILTSIFSNFIDIWNLHRSFFSSLSSLLVVRPTSPSGSTQLLAQAPSSNHPSHQSPSSPARSPAPAPSQSLHLHNPAPPISPLLLSHFPYLSLYTPFVTAFPSTISSLSQLTSPSTSSRPNVQYNPRFSQFLKEKERDSRCGRLKLRDWLLTIVQRCPRYLMLIRDLIACTPKGGISEGDDTEGTREGERLEGVLRLITKITESLNTSLQTHAQTLSLISLQKSCTNLPPSLHLVSPGRKLIKRGALVQVESKEKAGEERREVLLFSDCLVWFARGGGVIDRVGGVGGVIDKVGLGEWDWDWDWDWGWSSSSGSGSSGSGSGSSAPTSAVHTPSSSKLASGNTTSNDTSVPATAKRPSLNRNRSRSDAQLGYGGSTPHFSHSSPSSPLSNASTPSTPPGSAVSPLTSSTPSTPALKPAKRRSMYGFGTPSSAPGPSSPLSQSHINPHTRKNAKTKTPDPPLLRRSMVVTHIPNSSFGGGSSSSTSTSSSSTNSNGEDKDKWIFKGKIDLINLDIVVGGGVALEDEDRALRRFEVMSPEGSFVLYADSQASRDDWTDLIRSSKSQVMSSINMSNPYSTLTSSDSKQHVRRALVAMPYEWGDERLAGSLRGKRQSGRVDDKGKGKGKSVIYTDGRGELNMDESRKGTSAEDKDKPKKSAERRRKIDHYVPAIWIPDRKTNCCMRCGKLFGWRRRRHHCRLCGRCVCGGCSGRTFFITDAHARDEAELSASSKPARACDACYDTVFPVVDSSEGEEGAVGSSKEAFGDGKGVGRGDSNEASEALGSDGLQSHVMNTPGTETKTPKTATMGTFGSLMDLNMGLSLPSWWSVPSLSSSQSGMVVRVEGTRGVERSLALMAIDTDVDHPGEGVDAKRIIMSRRVSRVGDVEWKGNWEGLKNVMEGGSDIGLPRDLEREKRTRIRLGKSSSSSSSHSKLRSYQAILEGFRARDEDDGQANKDILGEAQVGEGHRGGDVRDVRDGLEDGINDEQIMAKLHGNHRDGSAESTSGGSGWETDDVERDGDLERVTEDGHSVANPALDAQYTTPPKPQPSGLQSMNPYASAYSPSASRYSLSSANSPLSATSSSPVSPRRAVYNLQRPQRREDTARRSKRFSLPAIGVHAASVTAHTSGLGSASSIADSPSSAGFMHAGDSSTSVNHIRLSSPGDPSETRTTPTRAGDVSKRLSLVLMGRNSRYELASSGSSHPRENLAGSPLGMRGAQRSGAASAGDEEGDEGDDDELDKDTSKDMDYALGASPSDMGLGKGLAAAKLSELLERSRSQGKV